MGAFLVKYELAQVKAEILKEKGREKKLSTLKRGLVLSNTDKTEEHNTRNKLAEDLGWSTGKLAMADFVVNY